MTRRPNALGGIARAHALTALVAAACAATFAATFAAVPLAAQGADSARSDSARAARRAERDARPFRPSALFASDSVLTLTIVADFRAIAGQRDTLNPKRNPGTLRVAGRDGPAEVPIALETRGHFRLKRESCGFPPLRVLFPEGARRTPFAGQRGLKLVTHCRDASAEYEQYVLREYLAYRAHNLVTDASLRARLARVRYVQARDTAKVLERWGLFLESERELAERLGGTLMEDVKGAAFDDLQPDGGVSVALWEYFLGNSDWSLSYLHNVRLVQARDGKVFGVPYDFDFSGLVFTSYGGPPPGLGITSTRQRLWRGPCATPEALGAALAPYLAKRDALKALYASLPALDAGYARKTVAFVDEFYDDLKDVPRFARDRTRERGTGKCPKSN